MISLGDYLKLLIKAKNPVDITSVVKCIDNINVTSELENKIIKFPHRWTGSCNDSQ